MSDFVNSRSCRGMVNALVLDWSGTTADAYVVAPAVVLATNGWNGRCPICESILCQVPPEMVFQQPVSAELCLCA